MSNPMKPYWKKVVDNFNVTVQDRMDSKSVLELENVNNTSDLNKPISTSTQSALDLKVNASRTINGNALTSDVVLTPDNLDDSSSTHKFIGQSDLDKLSNITVTSSANLDQMQTDIAALGNGMVYKGNWDASVGSFPGSGVAKTGWLYYVSVSGTVDGISFDAGDNIIATTDNASTTTYSGNWSKHDQTDAVQNVVGLTGSIDKTSLLSALNVEDGADVTDSVNVKSAGATMNSDTDLSAASYFLNENDLYTNSSVKVPSQQSVKFYIDSKSLAKDKITLTVSGAPHTLSWGNQYDLDSSLGSFTVMFPSTSASNNYIRLYAKDATNPITLNGNGSTINGSSTDSIDVTHESGLFQDTESGSIRRT